MTAPAAPPTTAPMIAPLAVDPVLLPMTPPTAAPAPAPMTAPRSLLFMLAHADSAVDANNPAVIKNLRLFIILLLLIGSLLVLVGDEFLLGLVILLLALLGSLKMLLILRENSLVGI